MPRSRLVVWIFAFAALGSGMSRGQDYPYRPIRILASEPGGLDLAARLIAAGLTGSLHQQVIIDNRGIIAGEIVAKAPADGYTLLAYGSPFWLAPLLRDYLPYDVARDFAALSLLTRTPGILAVHPSVAAKTVKELIALAKTRPGEINYASGSTGSTPQLAAELFKTMAGVDIVRINYKGTGPAISAFIGGQIQLMFANAGSVMAHLKSGRLRGLAVTSVRPSALAPGLPTVNESGVPGYESVSLYGMFAPARTPAAVVHRLNQELVRLLNRTEVKEELFNSGVETVGSAPEVLAITIKSEMAKWSKVIKDAGLREP